MPNDAMSILTHLTERLGRQPTLTEMIAFAGNDPAGYQADPANPEFPSRRQPEYGDGPLTADANAEELIRGNPELLRVRDQMVRMLLFGLDPQGGLLHGQGGIGGGGLLQPPTAPNPGPLVRRGIGGGGYSTGSGPAGGP